MIGRGGVPVVGAGKEADAKDVRHMLSLEHHAPTISLGEAPQAHLGDTRKASGAVYRCEIKRILTVETKLYSLQTVSQAPKRTFRSSDAEASKDPSSFQHTRLTQPSWPSNRCSTDSLRAKASLYDDHLSCKCRSCQSAGNMEAG